MNANRIEHVVVLMLENRSFDHMLGAVPDVDGADPQNPRWNRVSPTSWVRPGSAFRPDKGFVDHTSVPRFLSDHYSLGPLGNRVASAASFSGDLCDTSDVARYLP